MAACVRYPPRVQTNPRYAGFTQTTYTVGDVQQFNAARWRDDVRGMNAVVIDLSGNAFANLDDNALLGYDSSAWHKYDAIDARAPINSFAYAFHKFKKGVWIKIANGRVQVLPFSNARYRNEYPERLDVVDRTRFADADDFFADVAARSGYAYDRRRRLPANEWVANNAMFRYDAHEGDNNVEIIKDMFETLVGERAVPDIELIVNRRDNPILKTNETEPYDHVFDTDMHPLLSHRYDKYAPIMSCSTTDSFADVAMPTYEDWARARYQADGGKRMPNECRAYPRIVPDATGFYAKRATAVFRGSTTGAGFDARTNARLALLELADRLKASPQQQDRDLLDVGITKWNLRPRKYSGERFLRTIERATYPVAERLTLQQQTDRYRYIVHVEGHVAAFRLAYELSSGSTVIVIESKWRAWYTRLLKPYVHYVPATIDTLADRVRWCRAHDDECLAMTRRANEFYREFLGREAILDFLQMQCAALSRACGSYAYLADPVLANVEYEREWLVVKDARDRYSTFAYAFPRPREPRNYPSMLATLDVFRSKRTIARHVGGGGAADSSAISVVRQLRSSRNSVVELCTFNGVDVVRKIALNEDKQRENYHEAYVGLNVVNDLSSTTPNFPFVYGLDPTTDDRDAARDVYVEYAHGTPMDEWLRSAMTTGGGTRRASDVVGDILSVFIQLNLAIHSAQRTHAFVHYDLYPWNVMVHALPGTPIEFDYVVDVDSQYRLRTSTIATIVDFGKSRACVYERDTWFGVVDHGMVNAYARHSTAVDTLTLLFATARIALGSRRAVAASTSVVDDAVAAIANAVAKLLDCGDRALIGTGASFSCARDYARLASYGALFKPLDDVDVSSFPIAFVRQLLATFDVRSFVRALDARVDAPKNVMIRGDRAYTRSTMRFGNVEADAMRDAVVAVTLSTYPTSDNETMRRVIESSVRRESRWLNDKIERGQRSTATVKAMWTKVYNDVMYALHGATRATSAHIVDTVPRDLAVVAFDEYVTPGELARYIDALGLARTFENGGDDTLDADWVSALNLYADTAVYDPAVGVPTSLATVDRFRVYGALASVNSLRKLSAKSSK